MPNSRSWNGAAASQSLQMREPETSPRLGEAIWSGLCGRSKTGPRGTFRGSLRYMNDVWYLGLTEQARYFKTLLLKIHI